MEIFLGILAFLAVLITVILLLPVYVIIKTDEDGQIILRYKFLRKTYGENPDPHNPIVKTLKKASGVSRLEKQQLKTNVEASGLTDTVSDSFSLLLSLIKKIIKLLRFCKAKKFKVKIVCAGEDAAEAAINYGKCCAVAFPVIGFVSSLIKIRKKGREINISCNYNNQQTVFELETVLVVRVFRVLAAFLRVIYEEVKRLAKENASKE